MADLAEPIDDLICSFEGNPDLTMDTLAMFIFGWILVALFILWLGKLIYAKFILKQDLLKTKPATPVIIAATPIEPKAEVTEPVVVQNGASSDVTAVKKPVVATVVRSAGGGGGSGYVPPTPPIRKRLSRKSPVPDFKRSHFTPAPQCTGPDNVSVLWVNDVFQWLYNDLVIVNEIFNVWIQSMNEFTRATVPEAGVVVEFIRILPETLPPSLSNLFCECDSKDDVTITCDCEAMPALQVKCIRQKGEKVETSHYRVNVNRFRARLNMVCISEKLQGEIKCDGWPDIKIALAQVGNIKSNPDEAQLQDVISEIVVTAIRNTHVHLNLAQYPTCPRLIRHVGTPGHLLPLHYGNMSGAYTSTPNHRGMGGDKRLLVKIMRATQLGANQGCVEPFCIVEMDDPPQKNTTSIKKDTDSPEWDEHFLFDLSPNTAELLFEVYDRAVKPNRFLGLGIVGVEELLINPSQRQVIALQSRPYESDVVSGTITVEFLFIEGADIPTMNERPFKLKETLKTVSPTGALITTTKTTFANGDSLTNGENLTDSALKELERSRQGPNTNKSTLIIHSVQRQPSQRLKVELVEGAWQEVATSPETDIEEKPGEPQQFNNDDTPMQDSNTLPRGRTKKKRDFFGTIKRRLGRSKTRSRSAGPGDEDYDPDNTLARSISADRAQGANESNGLRLNVPGLRSMDENSRRSSLSEASGLSGASTRTYINEASTLVLETIENGVKRHYLVPMSLAQKSKWRKKGTKLHIYNDHTFIAKHLPGGTICQVCSKSIARRLGKQGYECRDCQLKCHKHCHVKTIDNCPTSTIHSIELSYITNPYTDKNIRML